MNRETTMVVSLIDHYVTDAPEKQVLDSALYVAADSLEPGKTGLINADDITYAFMYRRSLKENRSVREDEVHDYVRHMLREADFVCRHAIDRGSNYLLHKERKCSPDCDKANARAEAKKRRAVCPDCFIELPMTNLCDNCH